MSFFVVYFYKIESSEGKTMDEHTAFLSNDGEYTVFSFGNNRLKFIAPYSLEHYVNVLEWDSGYLVVMAKYAHNKDVEEEYIDLRPILKNLYINPDAFLSQIKSVEVKYA